MPEINYRQENPSPEIDYSEIYIPDDNNLGTGIFRTVIKSTVFSEKKQISSVLLEEPNFQISVNLDILTGKIHVLLGRADGSAPICTKAYTLFTQKFNVSVSHELKVNFTNWNITRLYFDEVLLEEILPDDSPLPEHLGSLIYTVPRITYTTEIKEKILDSIFDLSKDFVFLEKEQGNTRIKLYRNSNFQLVYYHYNPTFGERELKIDFADAERQGARGFYLATTWSASKNAFYAALLHPDPKFEALRDAYTITEDKLKLIKENVQEFERLLNLSNREEEVHQFLKRNSILLGLTSTIEPISKFKLGSDYVTDFVIKEIPDGYVLVEIENPGIKLFKNTTPPEKTTEFNHAIEQIENWKTWVSKNHSYIHSKLEGISPNPVCWLIAGRRTNLSDEQKSKLAEINNTYKGIYKILTYEDILDRVNTVINKLN